MKRFTVKAYGEEYGLPTKTAIIEAENREEAIEKAWDKFPEYEDVGVWEMEAEK